MVLNRANAAIAYGRGGFWLRELSVGTTGPALSLRFQGSLHQTLESFLGKVEHDDARSNGKYVDGCNARDGSLSHAVNLD